MVNTNMAKVNVKKLNRNNYNSLEEYYDASLANFESAFKKFKKECMKEGIVRECRDRMYYTSKSEKARAAKKAGRRKQLKKMWQERRYLERSDY